MARLGSLKFDIRATEGKKLHTEPAGDKKMDLYLAVGMDPAAVNSQRFKYNKK